MHVLVLDIAIVLALAGCRLDNSAPKHGCMTQSDCNAGEVCGPGVCVPNPDASVDSGGSRSDSGGPSGGGCESFPPAACATAEGTPHPYDISELQLLLPGRWLWCSGDLVSGTPLKIGPADSVGFEFNVDATQWWLLVDDGAGHPVHRTGFEMGGTVEYLPNQVGAQVNLLSSGGGYAMLPSFTDGPPMHLRFSPPPSAYYVRDGSSCGGALQPGFSGAPNTGAFGGTCDPNILLPNSCPAIDGVSCSICAAPSTKVECVRPCHVATNDCPSGTCIALGDSHTLGNYFIAGACSGYDGYCE